MIGILDYEYCNSKSVYETVSALTDNVCLISDPKKINSLSKLIIPGVGCSNNTMKYFRSNGLDEKIIQFSEKGNFILGICVGMQILFKKLSENGVTDGLGFFKSNVEPIENISKIKTNIGWRKIQNNKLSKMNILNEKFFYFCHSYYAKICEDEKKYIISYIKDFVQIPAIVNKHNVYGLQFHPEKSQKNGIDILTKFLKL